MYKNKERCQKCGDSIHIEGFQCPAKKFQCTSCHKYGHFTNLCFQKKQAPFKSRRPKVHQLQAGTVYVHENAICCQSEESSSDDSFCLQLKVQCTQATLKKIPTPSHLITNLTTDCSLIIQEISILRQDSTLALMGISCLSVYID